MTILYWTNFAKKRNSTKRPTGGNSTSAVLKQPTSVEKPVFVLKNNSHNITYVNAFGHYYFVTDIVHTNNDMIELHCSCDVMATHKSEIVTSNQFVARCETAAYWDTSLIDDVYPLKTAPNIYTQTAVTPFITSGSAALVLSVKGYAGTSFWAMARAVFGELGDGLYSMSRDQDSIWGALNAATIFRNYMDPMQYITDAKIIPLNKFDMSGTDYSTIDVGYWTYSDPGQVTVFRKITGQIIYTSSVYTLNLQTKYTGQFAFMNCNKYRKYELTLPGVGSIELDGDLVLTGNNVKVQFSVDVTGGICYEVSYGAGNVYKDYINGNIAIPFAIHGQTTDYSQITGTATGIVGGAAGGAMAGASFGLAGAAAGGIMGAVGGITHAIGNAGPLYHTKTVGQDGSFARMSVNPNIIFKETIYDISGSDVTKLGAPSMQSVLLSNLSGYVQCMNAAVDINGFESEREEVIALMNSGFFIE